MNLYYSDARGVSWCKYEVAQDCLDLDNTKAIGVIKCRPTVTTAMRHTLEAS